MARNAPPTPLSRQLGSELLKLRNQAGLTLEQVSRVVDRAASWLSRIENGHGRLGLSEIIHLLQIYGVESGSDRERELRDLARAARQRGWWQGLGTLTTEYATLIAYEAEATTYRTFEPLLVPGLLQHPDYARAIVRIGRATDDAAVAQHMEARERRQNVLARKPPLRLHAIISAAALLTEVGGLPVLGTQLAHLVELAARANITVQVLRFEAGAHLASQGSFSILTYGEASSALGYIETVGGDVMVQGPREIQRLESTWTNIATLAMSPAESVALIKERASQC